MATSLTVVATLEGDVGVTVVSIDDDVALDGAVDVVSENNHMTVSQQAASKTPQRTSQSADAVECLHDR